MSEENQFTFENKDYRKTYWHTCSHVLAQAIKRLYPEAKCAIGPAIEDGFYYDFDMGPLSREDLDAIEREMKKVIKEFFKSKLNIALFVFQIVAIVFLCFCYCNTNPLRSPFL